jgi:hypothetical protein
MSIPFYTVFDLLIGACLSLQPSWALRSYLSSWSQSNSLDLPLSIISMLSALASRMAFELAICDALLSNRELKSPELLQSKIPKRA